MPNRKIFAAIVLCVFVLVMGLEWLPKQVTSQSSIVVEQSVKTASNDEKAIHEKEMSRRDMIGYSVVRYFLLLSLLLYIKIHLQRTKSIE
jgi:hypothetical protein